MKTVALNIMAAVLFAAALTSCGKESGDGKLLESITYYDPEFQEFEYEKFEYDEQNRIVKMYNEAFLSRGGEKIYSTTTITYNSDNLVTAKKVYSDNSGSTKEFVVKGNTITVGKDTLTIKNGYIVSLKNDSEVESYEYKDGNLMNNSTTTRGFYYSYDRYANRKSPFSNSNTPKWLLQYLVKPYYASKKDVDGINGTGSVFEHRYERKYDREGFPVKFMRGCSTSDPNCQKIRFIYHGETQNATAKTETDFKTDLIYFTYADGEFFNKYNEYNEYVPYEKDSYPYKFAFISNTPVKDFSWLSLGIKYNDDGKVVYAKDGSTVYEFLKEVTIPHDELVPEKPLVVSWADAGTMPVFGFSYRDKDGQKKYFAGLAGNYGKDPKEYKGPAFIVSQFTPQETKLLKCDANAGGNSGVKLLESITDENGNAKTKYKYDRQNRIVKICRFDGTETITYAGNLVTVERVSSDNGIDIKEYVKEKYVKNRNTITVDTIAFTINEDGYIVKEDNGSTTYQYKDGNLIEKKFVSIYNDAGDDNGDVNSYGYDDEKSPFSNSNTPKWLLQRLREYAYASKNNVLTSNYEDYITGGDMLSGSYSYKYEYDSDGFPTKQTEEWYSEGNEDTTITRFTYIGK
jgi:hypothetical protein